MKLTVPVILTFQSTLPTRGSDEQRRAAVVIDTISIHAPHEGERLSNDVETAFLAKISIHAPHEGERASSSAIRTAASYFNPRSPRGGATWRR